jgi:uncharacterized repeat protein (TIGR01451 family)/fimbrial isopeptide formation D2 family protein
MRKAAVFVATVSTLVGFVVGVPIAQAAPPGTVTVDSFLECANGPTGTTPGTGCSGGWIQGTLQASNSHYAEDQEVPQRLVLTVPDTASHTVTLSYQTRKGSSTNHAYDTLGLWNATQTTADPCQGIAAICGGTPDHIAMAPDPTPVPPASGGNSTVTSTHETGLDRRWTLYGGTFDTANPPTTPVHSATVGNPSTDDIATVSVSFKANSANTQVVLLFAGHLAVGGTGTEPRSWGQGLGASVINGGPYSFSLVSVDGKSIGGKSNNIQAGGIAPLPPSFTITKSATPALADQGQLVNYTVTVQNTGGSTGSATFVDDYADVLSPTTPTGSAGGTCVPQTILGNKSFSCTTAPLAPTQSEVFSYSANMPTAFDGGANTGGCTNGRYPIANTATLTNGPSANGLVCVSASPAFVVSKVADASVATPGQPVQYTVTVTNNGHASGSTSFDDDFDDRLSPTGFPTPACSVVTTAGNKVLHCTTGTIVVNGHQDFTYTANMPASFDGGEHTGGCDVGQYPVINNVTVSGGNTASKTVCVTAAPSFTIAKSADVTTTTTGHPVNYTITVTNGGKASGSTSFDDDFADSITPVGFPTPQCAIVTNSGNRVLHCTTDPIVAGGHQDFTYSATMPLTFDGGGGPPDCPSGQYPVKNTATLANGLTASKTVCVMAAPHFTVDKTASPTSTTPGGSVHYTITVTNDGDASGSTTATDDYDERLTPTDYPAACQIVVTSGGNHTLVCDTGKLPAKTGTVTFSYNAIMPGTFTGPPSGNCGDNGYPVINTVTLNPGGAQDTAPVCVTATSDLTITKTAMPSSGVKAGDPVTYTITVSNANGTAPGSTTFIDDYDDLLGTIPASSVQSTPAGATCSNIAPGGNKELSCTTSTIEAGASQSFQYTVNMPATFTGPDGGSNCGSDHFPISNTATLQDGSGRHDGKTVCVAAAPNLSVTKSVDKASANPGDTLTYTVVVHNTGTARGSTTFTDNFDSRVTLSGYPSNCTLTATQLSCPVGPVAAMDVATFTYQAKLPDAFTGNPGGSDKCTDVQYPIVNSVTLPNGSHDGTTSCVNASPTFTVIKTADPTTTTTGKTVNYTIEVDNGGNASGSTSFIDDFDDSITPTGYPTPACQIIITISGNHELSCTTDPIPAGGHQDFTYSATMPNSFSGSPGGHNCTASNPQQYPIYNLVTLANGNTDDATVCVNAAPAWHITKVASPLSTTPGGTVNYTVTVHNTGDAAGSTSFTDNYDSRLSLVGYPTPDCSVSTANSTLTCSTGIIAAGGQRVFMYHATMPASFDGGGGTGGCTGANNYPVGNSVTVVGGDSDNQTVCVTATPDFHVTKTASSNSANPGDPIMYTIRVDNMGKASGSTSFIDDYDNRLNVDPSSVTSDPSGNTCVDASTGGNKQMSCTTGTILAGGHQTFSYTVTMPATFVGDPDGTGTCSGKFAIVNTVTVTDGGAQGGSTVCVTAAPKFEIVKSVTPETANPGDPIMYTVTVYNKGTASGSTSFTDDYDDRLTLTGFPTPDCSLGTTGVNSDNKVLNCDTGTILAGGHRDFTYSATVPATFTGPAGGHGCTASNPQQYAIFNSATLKNGSSDDATVCVNAAPDLTITKSASATSVGVGAPVTYTITVHNGGAASGSTSFVDDFDDRLAVNAANVTISGSGGSCSNVTTNGNKTLSCTTGTILANGDQTFMYTVNMPASFDSTAPTGGCGTNQFPVTNTAKIDATHMQSVTVCVTATPNLVVDKSVTPTSGVKAGDTVTYSLKVTNMGTAPGNNTFTDNYDNRLTPSGVTVNPPANGAGCTPVVIAGDNELSCMSGVLDPGASRTFTYTAAMPSTFSGAPGGSGCSATNPQQYPVNNTALLDNGNNDSVTVCVNAAPIASVSKTGVLNVGTDGSQTISYTITYHNDGTADAQTATIADSIPAGTSFVGCTPNCSQAGSPVSAVSWSVGPVAAGTGGFVTLTVQVTTTTACQISNAAQLTFDSQTAKTSNTVSTAVNPLPNPAGAHASGNATGAQILSSGILNINTSPIGRSATSQTGVGAPVPDNHSVLSLSIPPVISADALTTTSSSAVTPLPNSAAVQQSTSEVAHLCVVPIAGVCTVEADAVRAVATTVANGNTASYSSAGSTITGLKVVGLGKVVDLNQTTKINLSAAIFGKNSYVAINERAGSVTGPSSGQTSGGTWSSDLTVTMIHVKITGVLGLQAVEVIVGQAVAHSDYPQTTICGPVSSRSVSGNATVASAVTSLHLADLYQGFVAIPPTGGSESQQVVGVALPADKSLVGAAVGSSSTTGSVAGNPTSASIAEVAGDTTAPACVLRLPTGCVVTAKVIHSEAHSTATNSGSTSSDAGTVFTNVSVLGIPIAVNPAPNTVIGIPGVGFVVLNEQVCDGGGLATHSCTGKPHSGITVRAIDIVVNVALNPLGLIPGARIVVAEAHADTSLG